MSKLEGNYKIIDALNAKNKAKIESGELDLLEYDRTAIISFFYRFSYQIDIKLFDFYRP